MEEELGFRRSHSPTDHVSLLKGKTKYNVEMHLAIS
jgi:hypothetical protein